MFGRFRAARERSGFLAECSQMLQSATGEQQKEILDFVDDHLKLFLSCCDNKVSPENTLVIVCNAVLKSFLAGERLSDLSPLTRSSKPEKIAYLVLKKYCEVIESGAGAEHVPAEFRSMLDEYRRRTASGQ